MQFQNLNAWNLFYQNFDPIAFELFGLKVHWYGICYVSALILALFIASYILKKNQSRFGFSQQVLDSYFIWAEIGVILGARLGYLFIYSDALFYLVNPHKIFSPFDEYGNFVGIAGFSYHGGVIGFLVATILFCYFKRVDLWKILDLATLSIPLAYFFGRVGNFLNQELLGKEIQNPSAQFLGIWIEQEQKLRYPSQLFEAFSEGILLFFVLLVVFRFCKTSGVLAACYGMGYAAFRAICEIFREPDAHMGYYAGFTMGQILSIMMFCACAILALYLLKFQNLNAKKGAQKAIKSGDFTKRSGNAKNNSKRAKKEKR